jgi:hypothetical protein
VAPIASALHIAIVEPALAAAYAGFAVLASLTLIPLRVAIKSFFKRNCDYTNVIEKSINDSPSTPDKPSPSVVSSTAQVSRTMSISLTDSLGFISTSPSSVGLHDSPKNGLKDSPKALSGVDVQNNVSTTINASRLNL